MIRQKHLVALSVILIFSLLLTGCNWFGPAATPTPDPLAQQATIDAAILQTMQVVSAEQTSVAAALPTSTFTVAPTQEPPPTNTPQATWTVAVPTATKTFVPVVPTKTKTPTPAAYACKLVSTSPTSGTKITLNGDFDGAWKVQNVGTKAWEVGYLDLKYVSGTKMQTGADIYDIGTAVAVGGELSLVVDMKAPATAGKYSASWALVMEGVTICTLPVDIEAIP
jgi:hypothetical protein